MKKIQNALISVYHKDGIDDICRKLNQLGVKIISTGGTAHYIEKNLGIDVTTVESITSFPSIFGGRVKTLHPLVFGGILYRRDNTDDNKTAEEYKVPSIDLVIVDLYPFEKTVESSDIEAEIIEKIDIGGISLIRAAAKNFTDVLVVSSKEKYEELHQLLLEKEGYSDKQDRKKFASHAFNVSSHYDTAIFNYFNKDNFENALKVSCQKSKTLRYGENPHQKGTFFGDFEKIFDQLHGKEISYNNLLDIDAAVALIDEFEETTFAVLKHNNPCGLASREKLVDAWKEALDGDSVSAYGGILVTNREIDLETAEKVNKIFFEVIIAPAFEKNALEILKQKKNRIILLRKPVEFLGQQIKTVLSGVLVQDKDLSTEAKEDLKLVTKVSPSEDELNDLVFANKIVKNTKSNAMVLVKDKKLLASGMGQTSRVDALKQAIVKAKAFKQDLKGAVMASDAYFPFPDNVEIAHNEGINAVIQPGGSIRDKESVEFCDNHGMSMVFTGIRHFKH